MKTEVYAVVLIGMEDILWYILDSENWEKIVDDKELFPQFCEGNISSLFKCYDTQEMFEYLAENNYVVVGTAKGQLF